MEVQSSNNEAALQETVFCQISANYSNGADAGLIPWTVFEQTVEAF